MAHASGLIMADDNKPTADQIQFALDLSKEKGKDYTKSKLQGMSGKEVSDAIDSMKKEETESSGKQVSFALDLLKEQGKSSPSKAQLEKMPAANISKLIDKLKGSDKEAKFLTAANNVIVINDSHGGYGLSSAAKAMFQERTGRKFDEYKTPRHHPVLVEIVKELGSKGASGSTARLKLFRLSGGKYKIDNYDGMETPVEPGDIRWISTSKLGSTKTGGMFNSLDSDQESLAEELYMMASNDGAAYKKRDADGAAKKAMRELRQSRLRDLDYDMKMAHKAVVKALKARWRQSDKEHRQNQRAASMNKRAIVQEAMKRAKVDPEFRKKLVAAVQKKAKPGGGPVSKKEYDGFFKHLMAAYKMASKWEEQDKPGGYVANESIGAFMEKLKRDMKKHVK